MKKILIILLFVALSHGASDLLFWTGGTADHTQDWSTATNWGLTSGETNGHVPLATDSCVFDNASTVICTLTEASTCKYAIFKASSYTQGFKQGGPFPLTVANDFMYDGTGTVTLNDTTICGGTYHLGSTITTATVTSGKLKLTGTGNWDLDKVANFLYCVHSFAGQTTTWTGSAASGCQIDSLAGGSFSYATDIYIKPTTANFLGIAAGSTITGTSGKYFYIALTPAGALTMNLPKLIISTDGNFWLYKNAAQNINLVSLDTLKTPKMTIISVGSGGSGGTFNYTTNNQALIVGGTLKMGSGNASAGATSYNLSGSYVQTDSFTTTGTSSSACTYYLDSCAWSNDHDMVWSLTNNTVTKNKETITFTGDGTLYSRGKIFNNIAVNGSAKKLTLADSLTCSKLTITSGGVVQSAKPMRILGGGIFFNSADTSSLDGNITFTGNGKFYIDSTATKIGYSTGCNGDFQGNDTLQSYKIFYFNNLTGAYEGKTTRVDTGIINVGWQNVLTMSSGRWQNNYYLVGNILNAQTDPLNLNASVTIGGNKSIIIYGNGSSIINIPAVTTVDTVSLQLLKGTGTNQTTYSLGGNLDLGGWFLHFNGLNGSKNVLITNNYAITCGNYLVFGCNNSTTTAIDSVELGSSAIQCSSYTAYNNGITKINLGSSSWTITGNTLRWNNHNVCTNVAGTSLITFTDSLNVFSPNAANFYRMRFTGGKLYRVTDADTLILGGFSAGDFSGSAGNLIKITSYYGGRWYLNAPAGVIATYCDVTNSFNYGATIMATGGTNVDGGNNFGWLFKIILKIANKAMAISGFSIGF